MGKDVAVEGIDAPRRGPGIEGQIIALTWGGGNGVHLLRAVEHLPILSHKGKEVAVHVHGMNQLADVDQANVDGLPMLDVHRLGIREAFAVDDVIAAQFTNYLKIFLIGMDGLRGLWGAWFGVDDEGSIQATGNLNHVGLVRMVEIRPNVVERNGEIIGVRLAWLDRVLAHTWNAILAGGDFQAVPVNGRRFREMIGN